MAFCALCVSLSFCLFLSACLSLSLSLWSQFTTEYFTLQGQNRRRPWRHMTRTSFPPKVLTHRRFARGILRRSNCYASDRSAAIEKAVNFWVARDRSMVCFGTAVKQQKTTLMCDRRCIYTSQFQTFYARCLQDTWLTTARVSNVTHEQDQIARPRQVRAKGVSQSLPMLRFSARVVVLQQLSSARLKSTDSFCKPANESLDLYGWVIDSEWRH